MGAEVGFTILVTAVILAAFFAFRATSSRKSNADRRLEQLGQESQLELNITPPPSRSVQVGKRSRFDQWFDVAVQRSGLDASPAGVAAVMFLAAVVLGGGLFLWKERLGLAGLGVALGVLLPFGMVVLYHRRYRWQLQSQLPDAYRMLSGSVRAGQTLEQAIEFYSDRGVKPLAEEFGHTAALMRLGMSPAAALEATAPRIRLLDFDLLVSTVGLYTQTGGNLVLLLERLADSVRDRNQFQQQFFAATAQSRIVAIAVGLAGPLLLLVYTLAEPEYVQTFLQSPSGWTLLAVCGVLEIIGVIWLWRILRVDY